MTPNPTIDNVQNVRFTKPTLVTEHTGSDNAPNVSRANLPNCIRCDLGATVRLASPHRFGVRMRTITQSASSSFWMKTQAMTLTSRLSILANLVGNIVSLRAEKKMPGVNAPFVVAVVQNKERPWKISSDDKREPVSAKRATLYSAQAVAQRLLIRRPQIWPTLQGSALAHSRPKRNNFLFCRNQGNKIDFSHALKLPFSPWSEPVMRLRASRACFIVG